MILSRHGIVFSLCFSCFFFIALSTHNNPIAKRASCIESGCVRFTVLTDGLVRAERTLFGDKCRTAGPKFDDRPTYSVLNRDLLVPEFHIQGNSTSLVITTSKVRITHHYVAENCCSIGFSPGELTLELLVKPFTTWSSSMSHFTPSSRRSSVAQIVQEPGNLNGTMNYGPAFAGGLDCYSSPPDCAQAYQNVIGQGLLSQSGFAIVNDTNTTRLSDKIVSGIQWFDPASTRPANHWLAEDLYFLVSGRNYKAALRDWALVGGAPSLPPLASLGVWYSRYYPYGERTFLLDVVDEYDKNALPLSVGVLDVPWHNIDYAISDLGPDKNGTWPYPNIPGTAKPGHSCNGWDGFTFNSTLFPNPKRFFDALHAKGIKTILSVHMQNGIDHCQEQYYAMARAMGFSEAQIASNTTVNCTMDDPKYVDAFFKHIVESPPISNTTDWWWLDYPGGASRISGWDLQEPASLFWSNHMFGEHARSKAKRPVILARYGGLGAQRDGIGFSGDTFQEFGTLEFEIEMTSKASNVLFGWWSHDIGGNHNGGTTGYDKHGSPVGPYPGDEDPKNATGSEMLLRWIQFGVFSPIFRTHCEPTCDRYVWHYPHFNQMRAAMRLRNALVPYIYNAGLDAYHTGISLLRPMYYDWPDDANSYSYVGQYMFGDHILVAPIGRKSEHDGLTEKTVWLPQRKDNVSLQSWLHWNGSLVHGSIDGLHTTRWASDEIPVFVQPGTIVPLRTMASTHDVFVDPVVWVAWGGTRNGPMNGILFEDAGDGLEYIKIDSHMSSTAAFTKVDASITNNETQLSLTIFPTLGNYSGQRMSRCHMVQYRCDSCIPNGIFINHLRVPSIQPGMDGPGWYQALGFIDGRDSFTEPQGTLVVVTGRHEIRDSIGIEIILSDVGKGVPSAEMFI